MAILKNITVDDTGFITIPSGSIAQRPSSPSVGMFRYNKVFKTPEYYDGTEWVNTTQIPIVTNGLVLYLDAGNPISYPGSGTTWTNLSDDTILFSTSNFTYPSYSDGYFTFVNINPIVNNITFPTTISTATDQYYSRLAWFYQTSQADAWGPLIQNAAGNNSDMGLATKDNKLHFRQYHNSNNFNFGDTGYSSIGTFDNDVWVMGAITVDRPNRIVKFYINGSYDSQESLNIIGDSISNDIVIGGPQVLYFNTTGRMFKGRISTVFHYNKILSDNEIRQNFNALKGRFGL